ncbi:MAG: hypothetical protein M3077_10200 [Candidatus Dormibacteraeota bacterium]|nr:hypothetical protein [Candidatus Dormibacteraeota bacterium]
MRKGALGLATFTLLTVAQFPVAVAASNPRLTPSTGGLTWLQNQRNGQNITLTNTGDVTITFTAMPFSYGNINTFSQVNMTCIGAAAGPGTSTLPPGASCTVTIDYGPTSFGVDKGNEDVRWGPTGHEYQLEVPLLGYNYAVHGLYTLDAYGGVHGNGCVPLAGGPYWPGWRIARAMALLSDVNGAYVLDGYGGVHPVGNAPTVYDWPRFGFDIARDIKLMPTANSTAAPGYVLDGWGGIHPFGGASPVHGTPYWPHWDIAKKLLILPDSSGGYVLDGWGGLHPFAVGSNAMPPAMASAYWPGHNLARDAEFDLGLSSPGGVTLDAFGGIHPFGAEGPIAVHGPFWSQDVARAVRIDDSGTEPPEGWIMDAYGGLHSFESHDYRYGPANTIPVPPYPYWGTPLAVDLAEF